MNPLGATEEGIDRRRTPLSVRGFPLLLLTFQTLGIIYSDIGTSPLYVLNGIWPGTGPVPSEEDVIGGVSAILWSLTLLPLLKYVIISLRFGTHEGEGGTFALYQGLFPPQQEDALADRTLTGDSLGKSPTLRSSGPRISRHLKWPLMAWCLLGTSLTMADGIFTPAVSVTSAVGGIAVAKASVEKDIIPISIAILVCLFLVQRFGTARLAFLFAPVSFLWFLILAGTGIYNITKHPGIFRAFDPSRAVLLFVRTGDYDILAGVLLALTGCEAVFANLGQFNALSIQLSFSVFVYPALCLAYLGQGARLISDGEAVISNIFYLSIPGPQNGPLFWIVFVVAILATIIASQALITATFSLFQQVVNMKSIFPIRMLYTSDTIQGQVYLPAVNYALMISTIVAVAAFKNLAALTNAYGFAVATVMFSTTVLISMQMRFVKGWPCVVALGYLFFFGFFDGLFWGASLKKVPHGAWVPLLIGVVLSTIMFFWSWAKGLEDDFDGANRKNLRHFIFTDDPGEKTLQEHAEAESQNGVEEDTASEAEEKNSIYYYLGQSSDDVSTITPHKHMLARIPSCAIFHKLVKAKGVPHSFIGFIRQWPALPRVVIFLSVSLVSMARVSSEDQYSVTKVRSVEGFYGVTYRLGFRDKFEVKVDELINRICAIEMNNDSKHAGAIIEEIRRVAGISTHIVPHYHVSSKQVSAGKLSLIVNCARTFLIEEIYRRLATMFPETANWLTSADEIIHVGINASI